MLARAAGPKPQVNPQEKARRAQAELARRQLAAMYLTDFASYVDPDVAATYRLPHLQLVGRYVDAALDGSLWANVPGTGQRYLFINLPPGYWKSSLISRKLPAYAVGRLKNLGLPHQIILASYNATVAQGNNRKVLELLGDKKYQNVFPDVVLNRNEQNAEQWSLVGDPFVTCKAAGVGGGLTGYHAFVGIVDDPIKDRADANSAAKRETLWEWWTDVLATRILKGGFIIGMWTRWSEDDPQGRLLKMKAKGMTDDQIAILRLPALAETEKERAAAGKMGLPVDEADPLGRDPGEPLWAAKQSQAELDNIRRAFPITFDSLYQQLPRPQGGYVVGEQMFRIIPKMPEGKTRWVWGTDWAITEKQVAPRRKNDPDYTVAALVGLRNVDGNRENARLVIAFVERGQLDPHSARQMVKGAVTSIERKHPIRAGQDNIDKVHFDAMRGDADLLHYSIANIGRDILKGDKMTKALPWLEMVQAGRVDVVQGPWNEAFFREVESFPHGAHDDQVDAVSVAVAALGIKERETRPAKSYQG